MVALGTGFALIVGDALGDTAPPSGPADSASPRSQSADTSDELAARAMEHDESIGARVSTVAVRFEPGRRAPTLPPETDDGASHDGSSTERLAPGTDTVGATIPVPRDANLMIIEGAPDMRLAYRTTTSTQWQEPAVSADEAPDDGRPAALGPVWIGAAAGEVELVVIGGIAAPVDVTFLAPAGDDEVDPAGPSAAVATDGGPAIMPRSSWASAGWNDDDEGCGEGPDVADHIQAVVVHHTVTTNRYGRDDVDDLLRAIYYSHVVVNGWCDVGYNFVVDRFGTIWEARTGSIEAAVIGGHAKGFNTGTVGVALLGQHHPGARPEAVVPTGAADEAVTELAAWKLGRHHVDPLGRTWLRNRSSRPPHRLEAQTWHNVPTVLAHRDLGVTSCPGNHGVELTRRLPERLASTLDRNVPYALDGWQPHQHGPGFVIADRFAGVRPAGTSQPWRPTPSRVDPAGAQVAAVGGASTGGYLLTTAGNLIAYGSSPPVVERPSGDTLAVDIDVRRGGVGGRVLDVGGRLHGFGGTADLAPLDHGALDLGRPGGPLAVAVALTDDGRGQILDSTGRLHPVGGAPAVSIDPTALGGATVVDLDIADAPGGGDRGWVLDSAGRVHGFGGAPSSTVATAATRGGVMAVAAADVGPGGWVLDAEGQLWPFGGARYVFPVMTDATARRVVDIDHVGDVNRPAFLDGHDARYLGAVHRLLAGREPGPVELDLAATALEQGGTRRDLTEVLVTSDHWAGATIDTLYLDVLGRPADPSGQAYWVGEVAAGLKVADLGTYFYGSDEYARSAGGHPNYVTALYQSILHRPPDTEGLDYWVGRLRSGQARPVDVAAGFYASVESRRDRVSRLHQQILGRPPTGAERDDWAGRLPEIDDTGLAARLAASSEYYRLAAKTGDG